MMITDTIATIKKRRQEYKSRKNSSLNDQIKRIRMEIVKLSFQNTGISEQKSKLQEELAGLKHKLSRFNH